MIFGYIIQSKYYTAFVPWESYRFGDMWERLSGGVGLFLIEAHIPTLAIVGGSIDLLSLSSSFAPQREGGEDVGRQWPPSNGVSQSHSYRFCGSIHKINNIAKRQNVISIKYFIIQLCVYLYFVLLSELEHFNLGKPPKFFLGIFSK